MKKPENAKWESRHKCRDWAAQQHIPCRDQSFTIGSFSTFILTPAMLKLLFPGSMADCKKSPLI
jgi:hypothetical protein